MFRSAALILFLVVSLAPAQSTGLVFSPVAAGGALPAPRQDGAIAYDPGGRQLLLFGGLDNSARNDLWAFSLDRRQWTELNPSGARPPARFGHTAIFDPQRQRLVIFGGQAGGFFSDTWVYDVRQNAWQQISPDEAGPSRRYGHSAIYDATRDRMIISHGFTDAGRFDDTWAFNLAANTWQNISPSGTRPLRRCLHHAAYDPAGDQMLLFGGCSSGFGPCPEDDLWSFDLTAQRWMEVRHAVHPPARQWYGLAFDTARRRLILFGGGGSQGALNDTWEYDPAAGSWQQVSPAGPVPAARSRHETVYVPDLRAAFFFGGRTDAGLTNELLMLAAPDAAPQFTAAGVVNAFSGQTGAVAPGEIVSIFGTGLGPDGGLATSFDPETGRLPTRAGGVSVRFNLDAAPLYFTRHDQLNAQVPYEVAGQPEIILTVNFGGRTANVRVPVVPTRPGLYPQVFNEDGTPNSAANPARQSSIIVLFGTGQGVTDPPTPTGAFPANGYPVPAAPVILRVGGRPAELLFQGQAPGTAGVIQINARLPEGVSGEGVPVVLQVGEGESQTGVTVNIR